MDAQREALAGLGHRRRREGRLRRAPRRAGRATTPSSGTTSMAPRWTAARGGWSGETDIMENIGYADYRSCAPHGSGYSANGNIGTAQHCPAGQDVSGGHTYTAEWTPTAIRFFGTDRLITELLRQRVECTRGAWVFDHRQYVIRNLALGGAHPAGCDKVTSPSRACRSRAWTRSRRAGRSWRSTGCRGNSRAERFMPCGGSDPRAAPTVSGQTSCTLSVRATHERAPADSLMRQPAAAAGCHLSARGRAISPGPCPSRTVSPNPRVGRVNGTSQPGQADDAVERPIA